MALDLSPAFADRHCLPSQEAFYGARYALRQDGSGSCQAALEKAVEALESAYDHARACGCGDLTAAMRTLIEDAGNDEASCQSRATGILDHTERVEALVRACH